jgi:hypothetical protein
MKKIYRSLSIIACVAVCSGAMAQSTTITAAALPQVGYVYNQISDTNSVDRATFTVSAGSASMQTWNYTTQFVTTFTDNTAFVAPAGNPGASNFPGSNLAANLSGNWGYFTSNSSGLVLNGADAVIGTSTAIVNYVPNEVLIPTPFTYGGSVNNMYSATFTFTSGSNTVQVRQHNNRIVTADAFGSITTPGGTYPNTLRVKGFQSTIDSIFVYVVGTWNFVQRQTDSTTSYDWLQNTQDAEVFSLSLDKKNKITKARYLQSFSNNVAAVTQPSVSFNLYPNPASDMTHLIYENKSTGMVNIQLIDITGKQAAVLLNEEQGVGKQNVAINLGALHLPKGLYFVQLNSSNKLQTIKLSIN